MNSVASTFTSVNEALLEDSILPEDIDEVLQQLESSDTGAEDRLIDDHRSSAAAVEEDGELYLGSCYRFGAGPDSWHCHSAFDTLPFRGRQCRQDCLWDLVRLYRTSLRPRSQRQAAG